MQIEERFERFEFQSEAIDYATNMLRGKSLSQALAQEFDLTQGTFYTYLPQETSLEKAVAFSSGIPQTNNSSMVKKSIERKIAGEIKSFLSKEGAMLVLEDLLPSANDEWFKQANSKENILVLNDTDICYYTSDAEISDSNLLQLLWTPPSWALVGILATSKELASKSGTIFDDGSILSAIVEATEVILFGAYDLDSLLFWTPNIQQAE